MKYAIYKNNDQQHIVGTRQAALVILEDIKRKAINAKNAVAFHGDSQGFFLWITDQKTGYSVDYFAKPML